MLYQIKIQMLYIRNYSLFFVLETNKSSKYANPQNLTLNLNIYKKCYLGPKTDHGS